MRTLTVASTACTVVLLIGLSIAAQSPAPPAQPYTPRQSDRPAPLEADEPGFQAIFDGKTLTGWEGDPKYWRVENGVARRRDHARDGHQEQHLHHLARRQAAGFRAQARLPHHRRTATAASTTAASSCPSRSRPATSSRCAATSSTSTAASGTRETTTKRRAGCSSPCAGRSTRVVGGRPPVLVSTFGDHRRARQGRHRRLERRSHHRPRQHADPRPQRTADERGDRRRCAEPPRGRTARRAGARRSADEGRIPEHSAQELGRSTWHQSTWHKAREHVARRTKST